MIDDIKHLTEEEIIDNSCWVSDRAFDYINNVISKNCIDPKGIKILNSFLILLENGTALSKNQLNLLANVENWYRKKPNQKHNENLGYIYIMYNNITNDGKTLFKIGYSTNPKKRLSTLQTGNPNISLLHTIHSKRDLECVIHKNLSEYKIKNEWFKIPIDINDLVVRENFIRWFDNVCLASLKFGYINIIQRKSIFGVII